jgi:uncharacterized protein (DUF1810 family)
MPTSDPFDLARFVEAQAATYENALAELRAGTKRTHWMWFIFPQLRGLGSSALSQRYGIVSLDEARAYREHPELGARLLTSVDAVLSNDGSTLNQIFGSPDDMKFVSSMTLFAATDEAKINPFVHALNTFCGGRRDVRTIARLNGR